MIIETNVLVSFENGLAGTFSVDEDFEQISFIPHEVDGEWMISVDYLIKTGIVDILESFNKALDSDIDFPEFRPIISLLYNIIGNDND